MSEISDAVQRKWRGAMAVMLCVIVGSCASPTPYFRDTDAPWRAQTEQACLRQNLAALNLVMEQAPPIDGPRSCGTRHPFKVSAAQGGAVQLKPAATLRCPVLPALTHWLERVVQPAAQQRFGEEVVELKVAASYGCRPRNNRRGAKLSEHGFANAIDISGFTLASGRTVTLKSGYYGRRSERGFLRDVESGACGPFRTVLGPKADAAHRNHFHMDMAWYGKDGTGTYCR